MKLMQRVSPGPVVLDFSIVLNVALCPQHGEIYELVCGHGKIEELTQLYRPHRQRRPDVGGG
jgi:hypothetical protein